MRWIAVAPVRELPVKRLWTYPNLERQPYPSPSLRQATSVELQPGVQPAFDPLQRQYFCAGPSALNLQRQMFRKHCEPARILDVELLDSPARNPQDRRGPVGERVAVVTSGEDRSLCEQISRTGALEDERRAVALVAQQPHSPFPHQVDVAHRRSGSKKPLPVFERQFLVGQLRQQFAWLVEHDRNHGA